MRSILEMQIENQSSIESLSKKNHNKILFQNQIKPQKELSLLMNGFAVNNFFRRYLQTQFCLTYVLVINLAILHIYFQMNLQSNSWTKTILVIENIVSLISIFLIIIRYLTYQEFKTQENLKRQSNKSRLILAIAKIIIICAQPYTFFQSTLFQLNGTTGIETYYLNDILYIFSLFRYGLVIPVFLLNSNYSTPRATRICKLYTCQSNYLYALKSFFKDFSIQTMIFLFFLSTFLFANAYRAAQYTTNSQLKYFQNALWLAIQTTLTVGYGQIYPKTILGRLVGIFCIYSGVTIMSVMIIAITNIFKLNKRQEKALMIINILQHKQQTKITAAKYIRQSLWRVWKNYKNRRIASYIYKHQSFQQRKLKQQMNQRRKSQKNNFKESSIKQQMQLCFTQITGYIQNLQENNQTLINYLQEKK